jgi:hypothetical protein
MFDDISGFPSSVTGALGAWGLVHVGYRVLVPWVAQKLAADAERLKRYDADLRSEVLRLREENRDLRFEVMTLKLQNGKQDQDPPGLDPGDDEGTSEEVRP